MRVEALCVMLISFTFFSTLSNASVIPNKNDLITLPLIKRRSPATHHRKRSTSEEYKLYNADKIEYLTKIYIGTPPQEFLVSIDTGRCVIYFSFVFILFIYVIVLNVNHLLTAQIHGFPHPNATSRNVHIPVSNQKNPAHSHH